jgi:lysophospholipase L1-like esterase
VNRCRSTIATSAFVLLVGLYSNAVHAEAPPAPSTEPAPREIAPLEAKGWSKRHDEKVAMLRQHKYDLLLVGDSITHNLDNPPFKAVWDQFYAPRNAIDLGYSGERVENILWNLQNGELDNQSPKAVVLLIGTNNTDDANYKDIYSPEDVARGTGMIVKLLRDKLPDTKILLLRIFPRQNRYWKDKEKTVERGSEEKRWGANLRASELASKLADDKSVFYLDVNHLFLRLDGSIDPALRPDLLHPSPQGALLWARAMDPLLAKLMDDKPLDTDQPQNPAVVPVPKLENDSYDWYDRHDQELAARARTNPQIVLIGDSITHFWAGEPKARNQNGPNAWKEAFDGVPVQNLGFGWDRTQNVLWRLDHGEFDGLHPKTVVLNIGTNNFSGTSHARSNTPEEVYDGIRDICIRIRSKSPESKIIVMGVFPRGQKADDPYRAKITELNQLLAKHLAEVKGIRFLDIGHQLTEPDGTISRETMKDFLHPTEKGYAIWAKALVDAGVRD